MLAILYYRAFGDISNYCFFNKTSQTLVTLMTTIISDIFDTSFLFLFIMAVSQPLYTRKSVVIFYLLYFNVNNWKKIKNSALFHRKVTKNFNRILNSRPGTSSSTVSTVFNLKRVSSVYVKENSFSFKSTEEDHNQIIHTATLPYDSYETENGPLINNDNNNEYTNNWLIELDDDNLPLCNENELYTKDEQLRNDIKKLACEFNITQRALKQLITVINKRKRIRYVFKPSAKN